MTPLDETWLRAHPLPYPGEDTDKNKRGRVLAAGGSETVPGALLLTGEAAFRVGAGKVQLATVERAATSIGIRMPEAAVFGLPVNADGELAGEGGTILSALLERSDALILGPGMGPKAGATVLLHTLFHNARESLPLLLDAALIGAVKDMAKQACAWPGPLVLTPHPGELAVLMSCDEAAVSPALAEAAAKQFDATIVFKTAETWIAAPDLPTLHYAGGGPGLATGGSGDILAGIIGGLLARGADPQTACGWGVWLHGQAGLQLAARVGELGFLASELLPEIPALMGAAQAAIDARKEPAPHP